MAGQVKMRHSALRAAFDFHPKKPHHHTTFSHVWFSWNACLTTLWESPTFTGGTYKRKPIELSCEYTGKYATWKKALTQPCWCPYFELPVFGTVINKCLLFISHPGCGILSQLPKHTKKSGQTCGTFSKSECWRMQFMNLVFIPKSSCYVQYNNVG